MFQISIFVFASAVSSVNAVSKSRELPLQVSFDVIAAEGELSDEVMVDPDGTALSCASGTVPCGANHCVPIGAVCCASAGHEELYCLSGQTCTTDGQCVSGGGGGGGGGCASNQKACGNFCIPYDGQCCNTSNGTYCASGTACTNNGTSCVNTGGTGGGGGGGCTTGTATQANCGGDTCGCADSCSNGSECQSGCCASGFCSPSCVCAGQGSLTVNCGGGGSYDPSVEENDRTGCDAGMGGGGEAFLLFNLGVMSLLLRRKRGHV